MTVTLGETLLRGGTDYTVSYKDNTEPGTATVTVTGTGSYSGSKSASFRIVRLEISWPTVTEAEGKVYGVTFEELVSLGEDGSATLDGAPLEGVFSLPAPEGIPDVGEKFCLLFTPAEEGLEEVPSGEYTLEKLQPKPITAEMLTISPDELPYDFGAELKPAVLVKDGKQMLEKDADFTIAYADNTEIGTASVSVAGKGNYGGTATAAFRITPIPAELVESGVQIKECGPEDDTIIPALSIAYKGEKLAEGTDYSVAHRYDIASRTGTATITFQGQYSGTLKREFKLPNYLITEGAGASWSKSTTLELRFKANGALGKFTGLTVDGSEIDEKYYSVESGSTVVRIKPDYLKGLTAGKHIVGVLYRDGKALAIFSVTSVARRGVATGDSSNALIWIILMAASLVALGTLGFLFARDRRGRKKRKKKTQSKQK